MTKSLERFIFAGSIASLSLLAVSSFPPATLRRLKIRDQNFCAEHGVNNCQGAKTGKLVGHHNTPKALGGSDDLQNGVLLCEEAHHGVHRIPKEKTAHVYTDVRQVQYDLPRILQQGLPIKYSRLLWNAKRAQEWQNLAEKRTTDAKDQGVI